MRENLRKMRQELKGVTTRPIPWKPLKSYTPLLLYSPPTVDIAAISAIAFHFNMYRKDNNVTAHTNASEPKLVECYLVKILS